MARTARSASTEPYADYLGWLSLGLGLVQCLAPRQLSQVTGLRRPGLMGAVGVRELATGVGLLTQRNKQPWLWGRVAGDAMDLLALANAHRTDPSHPSRTLGSAAVVALIAAADVATALRYTQVSAPGRAADLLIDRTIIVNKTPQECYDFWRDPAHLPQFIQRLNSVTVLDERRSRWSWRVPGGAPVQWTIERADELPGERIRWHTEDGSSMKHAGSVNFHQAPGGRGSLVTVSLRYQAPAGALAAALTRILGSDPFGEVREDLRRFKQLIETGEIPTTEGQPAGRRSLLGRFLPEGRRSSPRLNGSAATLRPAPRRSSQYREVHP